MSFDTDKGIWKYCKTHNNSWFPKLFSRSSFAKQASNLWYINQVMDFARVNRKYIMVLNAHLLIDIQGNIANFILLKLF